MRYRQFRFHRACGRVSKTLGTRQLKRFEKVGLWQQRLSYRPPSADVFPRQSGSMTSCR